MDTMLYEQYLKFKNGFDVENNQYMCSTTDESNSSKQSSGNKQIGSYMK